MASEAAQRVYAASGDLREEKITEEEFLEVAKGAARVMDERTVQVVSDLLHKRLDEDVAEAATQAMKEAQQQYQS